MGKERHLAQDGSMNKVANPWHNIMLLVFFFKGIISTSFDECSLPCALHNAACCCRSKGVINS